VVKPKRLVFVVTAAVVVALFLAFIAHFSSLFPPLAIIPYPETVIRRSGTFRLLKETEIVVGPGAEAAGRMLAVRLRSGTGFKVPVRIISDNRGLALLGDRAGARATNPAPGAIYLTSKASGPPLCAEAYRLEVGEGFVSIQASDQAGVFYGTQTLLQLLPPEIFANHEVVKTDWRMPQCYIQDRPRFTWRGTMLDVSRHFFNAAEIKKFLDAMALHKLNVFHWHLTDDQGWRIEIKRYPRLTEVGAWRKRIGFNLDSRSSTAYGPDGRYGGFYTQDQVREIVAYAQARHITIVPEIEMPGHSAAALAAYPEFSCTGGPYTTDMAEAVMPGVFCPGNEQTFQFLDHVLEEVMELFPGPFLHVGGDEVPVGNWHRCPRCQSRMKNECFTSERQLEPYFLRRIEQFINAHGRRMIGWSEIRNDGLAPSTVVMDWIGGGTEAALAGHDVVMSPQEYCYLDFYQSRNRLREPPAAGAYLPLEKVYSFEPVPSGLASSARSHILGGQGNLWTEYMPSLQQVEYMAFPRLSGLSEVFWSPKGSRNWADFLARLTVHERRLDLLGINYRRAPDQ
jgi:hexosaminidase